MLACAPAAAAEPPAWLPRYDLDVRLELDQHRAVVRERVTWTNRHRRPAAELTFNSHAHFKLPAQDVGLTAKMLEILRLMPSDSLDTRGRNCEVVKAALVGYGGAAVRPASGEETPLPPPRPVPAEAAPLTFHYDEKIDTALVVPLPRPVQPGETVTVELNIVMTLPQKMGRWGQWEGVTFLSNWLPVLACYDDAGWQPTPFIPWHQPFFNESGFYTARITLPADQVVACTGTVRAERDLGDGLKQLDVSAAGVRDFAILCSARFQEYLGQAGPVRVRCLAFPEHAFYARLMVESACKAIDTYSRWFGPYPYPEFSIVESFFGWNGNECSTLVMIDERVFSMPHMASSYVDSLISHETCHQWWYNLVGTNGYCETWMDEGLATHFSYKLIGQKYGQSDQLLDYPTMLEWLPNIRRRDYRNYGLYGTLGRGEETPIVQEMPKFGHVVNLFSMTYDKGSRVVGIIEDRLGEAAFCDFMRLVFRRYQYRILRVADFQRELEEYTGQSWEEFFARWVYGKGFCDWAIEKVRLTRQGPDGQPVEECLCPLPSRFRPRRSRPYHATVLLRQKAEYDEHTVLGICLDGGETYQVRIPVIPQAGTIELDEVKARVVPLGEHRVRVEVDLPCRPTQMAVDPDQVLPDRDPANNLWRCRVNFRFSPCYTFLDETDLTTHHDQWNVITGPWFYVPTFNNPWFTRSTMVGARAGVYRTQEFVGGAYTAYRTDYRDLVAGVDAVWSHWPWTDTEVGLIAERRLAALLSGDEQASRGVIYGRYILTYGDSLYLPPFQYVELFGSLSDNLLPFARETRPGAERFNHQAGAGLYYHLNYLTPYWDPEGGIKCDVSCLNGIEVPGVDQGIRGSQQVSGQVSLVKYLPEWLGPLSETRLALRAFGAAGWPNRVQYFALGGGEAFRGFSMAQRQGSLVWIGSAEWRVPLARHLHWDFCDHTVGLRNIYAALFYDVGDTYLFGESVGGVAHAVGAGLRLDIAWFTFIERTILRLDMAKTVNSSTPTQVWMGLEHPF